MDWLVRILDDEGTVEDRQELMDYEVDWLREDGLIEGKHFTLQKMEEFLLEAAKDILVEHGMNYGHPDVIQQLQDSLAKGLSPHDAVSKLSEIAYSMDEADYYWMA
jgi:hypothetical protein